MIKTLRVTSIIAVVLAAGFFVFPAVFGFRSDEQIEQFLNSPGAIEQFNKAKVDKDKAGESQSSPLVKQAQAFALYLNPPPKPRKRPTVRKKPSAKPKPKTVSAKFKLIGTSYYASSPDMSLALIDEPGKGLRWVRQSGKVSHLVIEQVKDGLVVVRDGERTFELVAERPPEKSLLKKQIPPRKTSSKPLDKPVLDRLVPEKLALDKAASEVKTDAGSKTDVATKVEVVSKVSPVSKVAPAPAPSKPPQPRRKISPVEEALMEKFVSELKAMQTPTESDKTDSELTDVAIDKFVSDLEAMRISAEEAEKLDDLGKELKDAQQEPNQADSSAKKETTAKKDK